MKEEALVSGLKNSEEWAFVLLHREMFPRIQAYVYAHHGAETDAEELFQEAVIVFIAKMRADQYESRQDSKVEAYFMGIAMNLWRHMRRQKANRDNKEQLANHTVIAGLASSEEPIEPDAADDPQQWIQAILNGLGEDCRRILIGFYYHKKSHSQLAQETGYDENYIRVKKHRCIEKLRKLAESHLVHVNYFQ